MKKWGKIVFMKSIGVLLLVVVFLLGCGLVIFISNFEGSGDKKIVEFLNVFYDLMRELY